MAEKDKLVTKLENFAPPVWFNPEHQELLKAQLERMIQETPAPSKIVAFRWQPVAALASAALFLIIGGIFFLQNRMTQSAKTALWEDLPIVMTTGSSSVLQNGHIIMLEAGKQVVNNAEISVAAHSTLSFLLPGDVTVYIQGPAQLRIEPEIATPSGKCSGIQLLSGILQAKQESGHKEKYAIAVGDTVYQPSGTVFQVSSDGSGSSQVLVQQGSINVSKKGVVKNQYLAKVTAGQSYSVDITGVGSLEAADPADIVALESFGFEDRVSFQELDALIPMTVRAQPPEAVISVDGSVIGQGTVSFMAEAGRQLEIAVNAEGYVSDKKTFVIEKAGAQYIGFELKPVEGSSEPSSIPDEPEIESEVTTENEKHDEMTLPVIPERAVTFTGHRSDWAQTFSLVDTDSQPVTEEGCDVDKLYLSKSGSLLSIGVAFINKLPGTNLRPEMIISLTGNNGDQIEVMAYLLGTEWKMKTDAVLSGQSVKITGENILLVGDDILELRLDLSSLGNWAAAQKYLDVIGSLKIEKFTNLKTRPDDIGPIRIGWK